MQYIKIVFCLFFLSSISFAQEDSNEINYEDSKLEIRDISEDDLKEYKNDDAFNYEEVEAEENFLVRAFYTFIDWIANIIRKIVEAIFGVGRADGLLYFIFNVLPYVILGILIFFLIRFFLKVNSKTLITGKQDNASFQFTEDEQIIKNEDINALINNAISQKNYRLAIRYYYLLSLKFLTEKQIITWQQQKTNEDYITEIESKTIKDSFKSITRIYDYVWYGEFDVDELRFESLKTPFETLNTTIKNK
ncbi:DUF4129 domain-containing protein [uncultured Psychroserpens sp.]|uniref:DUF4129 domain-containing protein n=1 Tax=uncultured Psychroserpens sp. TaxID=255436 RepID=UPI0026074FF1|nr:DUF4129 domain-containing protein [uncultured Psychroserpens sp.]